MAGTVNKAILIGHLGDNIKMHYFEGGNCIGRFPLATNETYTSKQTNERVTTTEWHNVVVRNKLAEICEKYLTKGDRVYCEGQIRTRQWESEGITRYTTEIHVNNMEFLTSKREQTANTQNATQNPVAPKPQATPPKEDANKDEVPF
ncbi:MAG: single-stranded DNA-binding protein [Flavobacteriaceae bacterium]|nr:single-stranded DNA-binding protein [Flavobacteriaceae bacterium]